MNAEDPPPPPSRKPILTEERVKVLFGSPTAGEDVEAFLARLDAEMDAKGLWKRDGTFDFDAFSALTRKGRERAERIRRGGV